MKKSTRLFLCFLLTLVFALAMTVSCHHEEPSSEDLFFTALEQAAAGTDEAAVTTLSQCVVRRDEWAEVASRQLLELLSDNPFLDVDPSILRIAREYHPVPEAALHIPHHYDLTFSALTLSGFSCTMLDEIASSWLSEDIDKKAAADLMAEAALLKEEQGTSQTSQAEKWLLYFYAGRLYEKNGAATYQAALENYSSACSAAYSELTHDRALWYFLELSRKTKPFQTATQLKDYSATWNDPEYFDDFLDRLASDILSNHDWQTFYLVYSENWQHFSSSSIAKYAYISARLLETGLCIPQSEKDGSSLNASTDSIIRSMYGTVLENAGYGSYYDLLARFKTGQSFSADKAEDAGEKSDEESFIEHLLGKLVEHDYTDLTFRYLTDYYDECSTRTLSAVSNYLLSKQGSENMFRTLTSLALKTFRTRPGEENMLHLAFPPYYRTLVEAETRQTSVEPWLLFALIHSESCFQADITSVAGAHGLTQLMEATAGDIARKLKMKEYDLNDADTNVKFGCFYLNELIGRLDGDILQAVFSYNAGITRVRNWKKQAPELPSDIFLETVPFEETRLYGQKITRSAVMYGMLYYDRPYSEILEKILSLKY